jgi:outer membrane protein TolC
MMVGVWSVAAETDLALPEKIFPQLDGILKTAVQQSPRMLNRVLDLEIAENGRIQARAGLLPTVGGSLRYTKTWDDRADISGRQKLTKTYYDLTITQPVFYWGERRNNARMGEIQAMIAKGSYREGYRMLCQELRSGYMSLISQKLLVKRAQFYVNYANGQLVQAEDRLTKKVISEAEIFPIRLTAEQAQIGAERAVFDFNNAKASFARLSGVAEISDDSIPNDIPQATYSPASVDALLAGYLSQRDLPTSEAVNMRRQLEVQNLTYQNSKTALRPKFSFVTGTTQDEQSFTLNVAQKYKVNSLYAGFSMYWAIFDGFSSRSITRSTLAKRRQMENDYRALTEQLTVQAQSQVKLINFSARNVGITNRYLESGEGTVRLRQEEFSRGVRSDAEVSQARISLFDVQVNAMNSRADYLMKVSDFLGTITEDPVLANVVEK